MKTSNFKNIVLSSFQTTAIIVALLCIVFSVSGCNVFGFLFSSGPYEKKIPPAYDLKAQQERKVMVWIECPRSAGADFDLREKLNTAFKIHLIQKAGVKPENIMPMPEVEGQALLLDPKKIAHSKGAGYLLLVHVDQYEVDFLQVRDYYAGNLITRSVLFDTDSGQTCWPSQPEGKMAHIAVEMETGGRDTLVDRLTSATAHCVLRNLYPCKKLMYKNVDERVSLQEAYEMETY